MAAFASHPSIFTMQVHAITGAFEGLGAELTRQLAGRHGANALIDSAVASSGRLDVLARAGGGRPKPRPDSVE